jgi:hypothetical protein
MIMERTKAVIEDSKFPKKLWAEIAGTVVYLKNRSPTRALDNQTLYEAWYKQTPDLQHLKILSCPVYVHIPKEKYIKLHNHTSKGQLVGYGSTNQWKAWLPDMDQVTVLRDVVFDEVRGEELMQSQVSDSIEVLPGPPSPLDASPTCPTNSLFASFVSSFR